MDMAMEFSWLVAALIIVVAYTVHNRINLKHSENLPPGSMGYPIIGEVFQFFASHPAYSLSPYMKERIQRYGTIFKTRLLGMPVIVSADAEFNNFVLQQEGRLFKMWYPEVSKIFAIGEDEARLHKYLRNSTLNLFGPESLKQSLLSEMDQSVAGTLDSWLSLPSVEPKEAIYSMIFHWGAKRLLSLDTSKEEDDDQKDLAKHFMEFSHAIVSFLSLPRSLVTNRFQGRKKVMKVVKRELEERLAHPRDEQRDLLDLLVQDMMSKEDTLMTKEIAMEIVFLLLFAVLHTMPMLTTFAIKFLSDHPDVLEELTKEHKRIVGEREAGRSWISWEEYKSMNYTAMVIKEVLRLVSPYVLRKSLQEINVKGYRIPKGWLVIVHLASVHMDPDLFPDPTSFNPSRWEDVKIASSCYMPFGGGPRLCAGMDFSKLFMTLFLHHLVTKYRWKTTKGVEIIQQPVWEFPDGFHIQLLPRS